MRPARAQDQVLAVLQRMMVLKRQRRWGTQDVNGVCQLLKTLPFLGQEEQALMPDDEAQLEAMLAAAGFGGPTVYTYTLCTNHQCGAVFRCGTRDASHCQQCGTPRDNSHQLKYMSLREHVQRIFSCAPLAASMRWHADRPRPPQGHAHDIQDTPLWQRRVRNDPVVSADSRSIIIGVSADGVKMDPNNQLSAELWPVVGGARGVRGAGTCLRAPQPRGTCTPRPPAPPVPSRPACCQPLPITSAAAALPPPPPQVVTFFNLPPALRWTPGLALVVALPPAGYSNLNGALGILVDEMESMRRAGVLIQDSSSSQPFDCRGAILLSMGDTRAIPHLELTPQVPAHKDSCNRCGVQGASIPGKEHCSTTGGPACRAGLAAHGLAHARRPPLGPA